MLLGSLGWLLLSSRRALSKDLTERKPDALLVGLVHRRPAPEHHHAHAPLGLVQRLKASAERLPTERTADGAYRRWSAAVID